MALGTIAAITAAMATHSSAAEVTMQVRRAAATVRFLARLLDESIQMIRFRLMRSDSIHCDLI